MLVGVSESERKDEGEVMSGTAPFMRQGVLKLIRFLCFYMKTHAEIKQIFPFFVVSQHYVSSVFFFSFVIL